MDDITLPKVVQWVTLECTEKPHKGMILDRVVNGFFALDPLPYPTRRYMAIVLLAQAIITESKGNALSDHINDPDEELLTWQEWVHENLVDTPTWEKLIGEIVEVLHDTPT